MKNKIISPMAIFAVSLLIIPQITFAAWWNPGTWKIFNKKSEVKTEQTITTAILTPDNRIIRIEKTTTTATSAVKRIQSKDNKDSAVSLPKTGKVKESPIITDRKSTKTDGELKQKVETLSIQAEKKQEATQKQKIIEFPQSGVTPTLSYTDLHCPKVIKIEDSMGNVSSDNHLSGTFKKGDVKNITVIVTASDPQNLPLYYQYASAGLIDGNSIIKDWSGDNSYTFDVTNAFPGTGRVLSFSIDNQDNFGCSGSYTDTGGSFIYTVIP